MGLGRFQLRDDGKREIAPKAPLLEPDRSTSPVLKPGASPARPVSPNILRPVSPNILRNAGRTTTSAAAISPPFVLQHPRVSASVASPTRPLVPAASVTASVEVAPPTTSGMAARRLSNPRLAAEAAARAAEAAASAAAGGQLYGLEAVKALARADVSSVATASSQRSGTPSEGADSESATSRAAVESATHTADVNDIETATGAALPAASFAAQVATSEPASDDINPPASPWGPQSQDAIARPAAAPLQNSDTDVLSPAVLQLPQGQHADATSAGDASTADHLVQWAMPPPSSRRMTRNGPASRPSTGEPA